MALAVATPSSLPTRLLYSKPIRTACPFSKPLHKNKDERSSQESHTASVATFGLLFISKAIARRHSSRRTQRQLSQKAKTLTQELPKHKMWGDVAVLDPEVEVLEANTASLLDLSHVRTVAAFKDPGAEDGQQTGTQLVHIAGDPSLKIVYKEAGLTFHIDLARRLSRLSRSQGGIGERERIAQLVQPGERILSLGSGFGLTACLLGKNTEAKEVVGVERNAVAHEFALKNIEANRLGGVVEHFRCHPDEVETLDLGKFDRVLAFLPFHKDGVLAPLSEVWGPSVRLLAPGGTVTCYSMETQTQFETTGAEEAKIQIAKICPDRKFEMTWRGKVPRKPIGPYTFRVGMDFTHVLT
eukprot:TRINITY_DN6854_c0_g2_i1.p1 TRINITY_DN6854_c0_g2~~TRINITY_DN6854_c0_g2_i1.p1  ORF type:complete len:371 (+),score=35.11 TRINITY_DN6854_c0_g2_i1:49-1113(+)